MSLVERVSLTSRAHMANWDSYDGMKKSAKMQTRKAKGRRAKEREVEAEHPSFSSRACHSILPSPALLPRT